MELVGALWLRLRELNFNYSGISVALSLRVSKRRESNPINQASKTMHPKIIRDLFNESRLLQQIGKLCLAIEDKKIEGIEFEHDGLPFLINLTPCGYLRIENIRFRLTKIEESVSFTLYNSRISNFRVPNPPSNPLLYEIDGIEGDVFDEEGEFTRIFKTSLERRI